MGPRGPGTLQCGHCTDVIHSHTGRQNIHIHRKKEVKIFFFKKRKYQVQVPERIKSHWALSLAVNCFMDEVRAEIKLLGSLSWLFTGRTLKMDPGALAPGIWI